MAITQHEGVKNEAHVVDQFEAKDLGAPFRVILHKAVEVCLDDSTGEVVSYSIPDIDGLIRVVVVKRLLNRRKLSGADIRFVRKAIGVKQKEMAQKIEMSHEHLSRCESGTLVLSPGAEKLLRIFAIKVAVKLHSVKPGEARTQLEDALDKLFECIKPVSAYAVDDVLELHFHLKERAKTNNSPSREWNEEERPPECEAA